MNSIAELILVLAQIYEIVIFARAIFSWFIRDPYNPIYNFLIRVTEPVLAPLRRFVSRFIPMEGIDLSPLLAILIIEFFVKQFLYRTLKGF